MWRRVRENGEASRRLLKPTLLRKGKSHQTIRSEVSRILPWQQVPSSSHFFSNAQLFVNKKASPPLQIVALAHLERKWGSAGTGMYACRCGDRRALLAGSAAKGKVILHWSIFQDIDPEKWANWSWQRAHPENLMMGEGEGRRCYL